jgi:hypothetical protein
LGVVSLAICCAGHGLTDSRTAGNTCSKQGFVMALDDDAVYIWMPLLLLLQAIEAAATLYDDYCRVITPENLLTEESEEVSN